jgi:hypothetical protein
MKYDSPADVSIVVAIYIDESQPSIYQSNGPAEHQPNCLSWFWLKKAHGAMVTHFKVI